MTRCHPHQKEGNSFTQINFQILKPFLCDFWGRFQIEATIPQLRTFHVDVQQNSSIVYVLGYDIFECHAIFRSIGNHLQQKNHVHDIMPLNCRGDKCYAYLCIGSTIEAPERPLPYLNGSKTWLINIEAKLSTWQDIAYMNMNKRCSRNKCPRGQSNLFMTKLWSHIT